MFSFVLFYCVCFSVSFFFFKQKTAYEMRISDWSSDVCSSDLWRGSNRSINCRVARCLPKRSLTQDGRITAVPWRVFAPPKRKCYKPARSWRSEEHTSELQSLMRISYAVFCLTKKKNKNTHLINTSQCRICKHKIKIT